MAGSRSFIEELHEAPAAGSGRRGQLGAIHTENLSKREKKQKWLYYPERGPNRDIDFSFPLRGPLARLICLKVLNFAREGSYVWIEELHRGASSKLPAAGSG